MGKRIKKNFRSAPNLLRDRAFRTVTGHGSVRENKTVS